MLLDMEVEKRVAEEPEELDCEALQLRARALTMDFDKSGTGFRDGHLDFLNFVHMVHSHPELVGSAVFIRPYFEEADADGNHTLDADELASLLRTLLTDLAVPPGIQEEIKASTGEIMKVMDEDGDGRIVRIRANQLTQIKPSCLLTRRLFRSLALQDFPEFVNFFIRGKDANSSAESSSSSSSSSSASESESSGHLIALMRVLLDPAALVSSEAAPSEQVLGAFLGSSASSPSSSHDAPSGKKLALSSMVVTVSKKDPR